MHFLTFGRGSSLVNQDVNEWSDVQKVNNDIEFGIPFGLESSKKQQSDERADIREVHYAVKVSVAQ